MNAMDKSLHQGTVETNGDPLAEAPIPRTVEIPDAEPYRDLVVDAPRPPLRIKLEPPVEYDGEKYSELIMDFDSMNGKSFQRAEREFSHTYKPDRNETIVLPESKHLYHQILASHLADVPLGLIQKLPRRYYVALRTEVLKACGSSSEEEKV